WLKRHEPAAFACALLNSQPMGFYSPSQIVQDARRGKAARKGVEFLPVDVAYSDWDCTLVDRGSQTFPCGSGHGRDAFCPAIDAPPAVHRGHGRSHREQGEGEQDGQPAIRLGLREVRGLSEEVANAIVAARRQAP